MRGGGVYRPLAANIGEKVDLFATSLNSENRREKSAKNASFFLSTLWKSRWGEVFGHASFTSKNSTSVLLYSPSYVLSPLCPTSFSTLLSRPALCLLHIFVLLFSLSHYLCFRPNPFLKHFSSSWITLHYVVVFLNFTFFFTVLSITSFLFCFYVYSLLIFVRNDWNVPDLVWVWQQPAIHYKAGRHGFNCG